MLNSLADASDFSSALEILRGTRYGGLLSSDNVYEAIRQEKKNLLEYIKRDVPDENIYNFFALFYDYNNFEAVAKARLMGYSEKPFCEIEGRYKIEDISRLYKVEDFPYDNLFIKQMLSIYKARFKELSPRDLNYLFVSYKFNELKSLFKKGILREIADYMLDVENISIVFRVKDKERLLENFVAFGSLGLEQLKEIDTLNLSSITSKYLREIITLLSNNKKDRLERVRARHILELIAENKTSDINVFLDYVFRKLFELKNINMIFSLLENGLTDKIKNMLIR